MTQHFLERKIIVPSIKGTQDRQLQKPDGIWKN